MRYGNMKPLDIIKHYGYSNQLKHLSGEVYELQEAIIEYEANKLSKDDLYHIAEEIADVELLLHQLRDYYSIPGETITRIRIMKLERISKRVKEENINAKEESK